MEYIPVLILFAVGTLVGGIIVLLSSLLGPKISNRLKSQPFECGKDPFMQPTGQFSVKFYLIAMLFILFDVEIVWFFPWAVLLRKLGWAGIFEMFAFIFVLLLGFVYAWKKGALEWEK